MFLMLLNTCHLQLADTTELEGSPALDFSVVVVPLAFLPAMALAAIISRMTEADYKSKSAMGD
jgi:hypothetical protein